MPVESSALSVWEREVVTRLVAHDHEALAELYDHYGTFVYGLATRVSRDTYAAEDVTQEVFLRVWQRPELFDPERGSMRAWLATLAHARAVAWVRRQVANRRRESRARPVGADASVEETAMAAIMAERARAAVAALPAGQRRAIELAYFGGLSYRQVASAVGVPEGTAKSRMRLGLCRIANSLQSHVLEPEF
jgi:RNA polymerase sigma-70 factor (ECF subfamily)